MVNRVNRSRFGMMVFGSQFKSGVMNIRDTGFADDPLINSQLLRVDHALRLQRILHPSWFRRAPMAKWTSAGL